MTGKIAVNPAVEPLRGCLRPPGDKSVSHRALIFGALADGRTRITGLLRSDDVKATMRAVEQLGARVSERQGDVDVEGTAGQFEVPRAPLDMGNSGTAMRLLAGVLAAQEFDSVLTGDDSLSRRPMRRIIKPLTQMGARISGTADGTAPLRIEGRRLAGIDYRSPIASAQVKSCVLLAGLFASGKTRVVEPETSRDHTERMLSLFGVALDDQGFLAGRSRLTAADVRVPADISSAAFPLAAALLIPGSELILQDVGINPTRTGLLTALKAMGAEIRISNIRDWGCEPVADLEVKYSGLLEGIELDPALVPAMIDEFPVFMALAACARGTTRIRGAAELRVKESDRLDVMATALRRMGATISLTGDGADIRGAQQIRTAIVEGAGDHRCAMALAVLGLVAESKIEVSGADMIDTSYPGFVADMNALGASMVLKRNTGESGAARAVPVIAIDGPVGSGKGTISTGLAKRLGWHFLDSGALYRLVALAAMQKGVDVEDREGLARVARDLDFAFMEDRGQTRPMLEGQDVSLRIRSEDVSAMASRVAAVPAVREAMVARQRAFARPPGLVADGRDMGTVIFPEATLKIFLTASVEARAERRYKQLKEKGESVNLSRLFRDIEARDARDSTRAIAPLKPADDSIVIDSTEYSINEVLDQIEKILHEKHIIS